MARVSQRIDQMNLPTDVERPARQPLPKPTAGEASKEVARRMSCGAEVGQQGVHFRVWAPDRKTVDLVIEQPERQEVSLRAEAEGYWSALVPGLGAGARYRYRLDGADPLLPDPFSRYQPDGPHGASQVVDPTAFRWTDGEWKGVSLKGQVIYEMHVGTFSTSGTWAGAAEKLKHLKELGVTVLQVMPVAEFPGTFGWGYDGVDLFAPYHGYGEPDDFRRFVDEAHKQGLAVILDVVYNHFGPDGNYLERYSSRYFGDLETEWGRAINYDGQGARGPRTLVTDNAAYWVSEYHLDGLRLDATQCIFDESDDYLVAALTRSARAAAGEREIVVVAENEPQHARLARPADKGGCGIDAVYNEDFHHSAIVAATGRREGYYSEYQGTAQELLSAFKHGFLFQGQLYHWQKKRRGQTMRGLPRWSAASFLENHDQVANSSTGNRLWKDTSPGRHRALTTLLLLGPWTPLLFQGSEWNASTPFFYFADHGDELRALVRKGRGQFLAQFPSAASLEAQAALPDPGDKKVFESSRLHWQEATLPAHAAALKLHKDLLKLRRQHPAIAAQASDGYSVDGAVLGPECLLVRFFDPNQDGRQDRLLLVNLGPTLPLVPAAEPLLAPPEGSQWQMIFSTDERGYGGPGTSPPESETTGWTIPAQAAVLLQPTAASGDDGR
ncbi:MAG TPA: malto-oligosyltrehalose trehalohydrolase [Polyangia bacterium]